MQFFKNPARRQQRVGAITAAENQLYGYIARYYIKNAWLN